MVSFWPFGRKQPVPPTSTPSAPVDEARLDPVIRDQARMFTEALRRNGGTISEYQVVSAFATIYSRMADTRKKMIRDVDKMRQFYLVDVIINQMVDDALAPEIGSGDILEITANDPDIQREINLLEEKFDLDQVVLSLVGDLLAYGEYVLSTKVRADPRAVAAAQQGEGLHESSPNIILPPGEETEEEETETGLLDLNDDVEPGSVIAITKWNSTVGYLVQDPTGRVFRREPADYVKFSLSSQRLRIDVKKELGLGKDLPEELKDIPKYLRVGRSIIHPIIPKLKELEVLEALVPASKLSKLSSGTLIGVQVPAGYDLDKAMEAAKQVEQMLNKKVGVDDRLGELTLENIMATAGRAKVVPVFGDKGQLQKMDYQSNEPEDLLQSVSSLRDTILSSAGIPSELVFSGEFDTKKSGVLKKYARYFRKLRSIQKAVEEGVRQIIYIHLANKGIRFKKDDVQINFLNKLIEIDNLDKLEYMDATVALLENVKRFFVDLKNPESSGPIAERVRLTELLRFLNDQLGIIGMPHAVDVDGDGDAEGGYEGDPEDPDASPDDTAQMTDPSYGGPVTQMLRSKQPKPTGGVL